VQRDEFRVHVRAAIKESGFNKVNIKEIILQQAICRGVPAANHAFKEAAEVIAGSQDPNNRVQRKDQNQGTLRSAAASSCGGSDSFSSAGRL